MPELQRVGYFFPERGQTLGDVRYFMSKAAPVKPQDYRILADNAAKDSWDPVDADVLNGDTLSLVIEDKVVATFEVEVIPLPMFTLRQISPTSFEIEDVFPPGPHSRPLKEEDQDD